MVPIDTLRALENCGALVAVLRGPDLVFELASRPLRALTSVPDPIGKPWTCMPIHAEGFDLPAVIAGVYQSGQTWTQDDLLVRIHAPAQPPRDAWLSVDAQRIESANGTQPNGVLLIGFDGTRRRRLEDQEAQLLRTVLDCAPITLFSLDEHGTVTLAEGHALAMAGKRSADLVGTSTLVTFARSDDVVRDIRRALRGEEFTAEHAIDRAILETHYRPLLDARGRNAGTVGVSVDITARRRAEQERTRMEAHLLQTQKLESLGVLAGGIAHDFNNLLTGIIGNVSVALAAPPSPTTLERLEDVRVIAQSAAELTRQMLAYAGRATIEIRPLDLSEHVREVTRLLQSSMPKKVDLRLDLGAGLPSVEADSAQIHQILMNLVINGAEAMGDSVGTVHVSPAVREILPEERLEMLVPGEEGNLPSAGPFVVLEVRDAGHGMDAATRRRIFDPFFTTRFTGRGLGLATVLGIVRSHRGALLVDSTPGQGTTVRVFFRPSTRAVAQAPDVEPTPPEGHGTVLIVDDEPYVRTAAARILEHFGFQTRIAANGHEGIDVFRMYGSSIDVVLLDMTMPDMDGEETLYELRKLRADVHVVLSSGYDEMEARARFSAEDSVGFLQKPYSANDLANKIREAMHAPAARAAQR